jgi:hypothetical protein
MDVCNYVSPTFVVRHIVFVLSVTQFVSATPLKLQNRISWNLVDSVQMGITPTIFRGSTFPGNMHNYIWCPYYLPSFMKFCSVVSEELRWQAASVVNFGKILRISRNILLKQFVSTTPLKLLNRISWNLVGSKDTICSCAYYQEMLIP